MLIREPLRRIPSASYKGKKIGHNMSSFVYNLSLSLATFWPKFRFVIIECML